MNKQKTKNLQIDIEECRKSLLTSKDKKRLEKICEEIKLEWSKNRPAYPYTLHDNRHYERVEEKIYQLLPIEKMKEGLSSKERFLIIASVWFHDIGMKPHLFPGDKSENELRNKLSTIEWDRKIRNEHAKRSEKYVSKNGKKLGLKPNEIRHLKKMCRLHRFKAYKELYEGHWLTNDGIRIQLLIAYLRLADALHVPHEAEPEEFKIYWALGLDATARFHWFKSKYTSNICVYPDEFKIKIVLKIPKSKDKDKWKEKLKPLKEVLIREVQDELDSIKDILSRGGLSVYLIVECNYVEDIAMSKDDVQQLEELIDNIELFDPTLTPGAGSVIGTVLKRIKLFLNLNNPEKSIEYLRDYNENVLKDILEKRPCHVFLWRVYNMLKQKLQDPAIKDNYRVKAIREIINEWKAKRKKVMTEIPKNARCILVDGFPILLYGYSDTIVKCLKHCPKEKKKDLKVYICEGRTKTIYRYNNRMVYCDGIKYMEELAKIGIKNIHYIPDSCASNLFSKGKISKVLFGANGIGLGGRVSHTLGHLAIANMASVYSIPVYVIADSMKIGYLQERPGLQRGNQWLTTDIEHESKIEKFKNYNPREDVLPPDAIQAIITEKGMIIPTEIEKYVENTITR